MQLVMLIPGTNLTISLGVATLQQEFSTNYGVIMAGAALAAVPIVAVFLMFQNYFTQGITMGAVKGDGRGDCTPYTILPMPVFHAPVSGHKKV